MGQLRAVLEEADDPAAAVTEQLEEWVEQRPERTARWETNQLSNAAARETWREAGVTNLRWVAVGDNCPYCTKQDGKVVAIVEPFMADGDVITDDSSDEQLVAKRNTYTPPMHPGCDCQIVPG